MAELELKHLAHYLPYKLIIEYGKEDYRVMNAGPGSSSNWIGINAIIQRQSAKVRPIPILHPLEEYAGKTTMAEIKDKLNCDNDTVYQIWDLYDGSRNIEKITYKTYKVMCKNHVDFNGLIEKELAIDINTLKNGTNR